jgi:hypothetical protein
MCVMMQEGNASVSKQPITWGGKKEEDVTVALKVAILGGGRGLSRPIPSYSTFHAEEVLVPSTVHQKLAAACGIRTNSPT